MRIIILALCLILVAPPALAETYRDLEIVAENNTPAYRRSLYKDGSVSWIDADSDGENTREEVLAAEKIGDVWVSVTFGPLTGSGLAFDPHISGERLDLGSSGLLFANNLVLYDRTSLKGYGPQLAAVGLCQGYAGQRLALVRVQEMSWVRWKQLHPDTKVVSSAGFPLEDLIYPFGSYDQVGDERLLFPMPVDNTRPIKERVLAIRVGLEGGRGYPFGELAEVGDFVAINETVDGVPTVVFFEAREGQAALAFDARVGGQTLTFDPAPGGFWTDRETGSTWTFDGVAVAGTHSGERLLGLTDAYTLFWFAWRQFQPDGTTFLN